MSLLNIPSFEVDKSKQTVAGQMDSLLSKDSPYMQQAANQGKQFANKRGLLNSSMAAGASQNAAISAALPIAQSDANTYNAFAQQAYGTQLQGTINDQIQGFTQDNMNLGNELQMGLNQQQQGFTQENMTLADSIAQKQMELQNALQQGNMTLANQLQQELNQQQQGFTQGNMQLADSIAQKQMELQNALNQGDMQLANQLQQELNQQQQGFTESNMQLGNQLQQENMALADSIAQTQMQLQNALNQSDMTLANELQTKLNEQQNQFIAQQSELDKQFQKDQLGQSTTANTQGKYLDAINQITNNAMVSINEIETAEGISQADKDAMIANTIARRDADLEWTKMLYSNMPTWDFSWVNIGAGEMPTAPGLGG
jgi:hypothetical protein